MDYGGVCFFIIIITFLYPTFYGKLLFENKTFYGKLTLGIIKWLKKKKEMFLKPYKIHHEFHELLLIYFTWSVGNNIMIVNNFYMSCPQQTYINEW